MAEVVEVTRMGDSGGSGLTPGASGGLLIAYSCVAWLQEGEVPRGMREKREGGEDG